MQNTPQTFRGTVAPGVNYSEHTYDNHISSHCQSSGYQPYSNQLYHPRPHHYGNHQMQQNMPYRHHGGGAYAPNQNQYRPTMNQDLYRNHHPGYPSNSNRNVPSKTWTDNNSNDLMPPYGQTSPHSQMMNNSQMPVTAMRSPPHASSNINQSSQGQQHFRPMQSPAHSPHSWSQAQIPSPNMIHSSRTSPLPAHVRSPGHSQPFSPPAAHSMNLQPHPPPAQENGQISQAMNNPTSNNDNHNPGNPLHSLQKMVLLDQESKGMPLPVDGTEQFPNQCGSHSYRAEGGPSCETKDSQYSTYYNIDENRFESKPNSAANDASAYTPIQQMTNCNFPVPSHPVSNEADISNIARIPSSNPNIIESFQSNSNQNSLSSQMSNSILEQSQCKSNLSQPDCASIQNECPPHAESAPLFTDQTKAAVSTNSEQALESKSNMNWTSDISDPENASVAQISAADAAGTPQTSVSQEQSTLSEPLSSNNASCERSAKELPNLAVNSDTSSCNDYESYTVKDATDFKSETSVEKDNQEMQNPSISTSSSESQDCDSNTNSSDSKSSSCYEDSHSNEKPTSRQLGSDNSFEVPSPDTEKGNSVPDSCSRSESTNDSKKLPSTSVSNQKETESYSPPPVKVVIHRIRKNDADDTWHVPCNTKPIQEGNGNDKDKTSESKSANNGPQIIMLSQAVSEKSEGSQNSGSSNSLANSEGDPIIKTENPDLSKAVKNEPMNSPEKGTNTLNSDKKRGRPVGSKNKLKPSASGKKKRNKKSLKNKKVENSKQKIVDTASKIKKIKNFNGPYVHIIGSKENPSSISVINVAQKEEEKLSKTQTKRSVTSAVNRIKTKTVGHLSTLSPTYDAYNRDKTWVCVFCQKGSHHGGLGDLYGPYYIKDKSEEKPSPSSSGTSSRNKRKKSESDDTKPTKKAKQSSAQSTPSRPQNTRNTDESDPSERTKEVWIHEDCAVWCQSITLIGEEVRGLDEAVSEANENKCSQCSFHGATLGCWGKGCKEMYHYTCAKEIGCQLDIEKFSLLCSKHQKKSENQKRCQ